MDKGDFIGREALLAAGEPTRRLVGLVLDDPRAIALGSEPVRIDGRPVGRVTSGGFGYTVERSLAYAYVPASAARAGQRVDVVVFGRPIGADVVTEAFFDPTSSRVRA
jgi:4-methylaminobutanoate oxidase (formaldehyde-forming)